MAAALIAISALGVTDPALDRNLAGASKNDPRALNAVRCTSPDNCWAVGELKSGIGPEADEALHWNGAKWVLP